MCTRDDVPIRRLLTTHQITRYHTSPLPSLFHSLAPFKWSWIIFINYKILTELSRTLKVHIEYLMPSRFRWTRTRLPSSPLLVTSYHSSTRRRYRSDGPTPGRDGSPRHSRTRLPNGKTQSPRIVILPRLFS